MVIIAVISGMQTVDVRNRIEQIGIDRRIAVAVRSAVTAPVDHKRGIRNRAKLFFHFRQSGDQIQLRIAEPVVIHLPVFPLHLFTESEGSLSW